MAKAMLEALTSENKHKYPADIAEDLPPIFTSTAYPLLHSFTLFSNVSVALLSKVTLYCKYTLPHRKNNMVGKICNFHRGNTV